MPRLAGMTLPSGSDTVVYTAPAGKRTTVSINFINRGGDSVLLNLALAPSGSVTSSLSDYIEYNTTMTPGSTLERTSLTPYGGESLIAFANKTGLTAVVWGYTD